jgi:hypothetical protein
MQQKAAQHTAALRNKSKYPTTLCTDSSVQQQVESLQLQSAVLLAALEDALVTTRQGGLEVVALRAEIADLQLQNSALRAQLENSMQHEGRPCDRTALATAQAMCAEFAASAIAADEAHAELQAEAERQRRMRQMLEVDLGQLQSELDAARAEPELNDLHRGSAATAMLHRTAHIPVGNVQSAGPSAREGLSTATYYLDLGETEPKGADGSEYMCTQSLSTHTRSRADALKHKRACMRR